MSKETLEEVIRQRDLLAQAIVDAAYKAGVINGDVPLDGPQLLMVLDDMAEELKMRIEDAEAVF